MWSSYSLNGRGIIMTKRLTDEEILAQIPDATAPAKADRRTGLLARAVLYHRTTRRFLLELSNGVLLGIPTTWLPTLAAATPAQLAGVTLSPSGAVLSVPALNADFSVTGIAQSAIGAAVAARAFAKAGGSVKSDAKAAAARANGAMGGRPRKESVGAPASGVYSMKGDLGRNRDAHATKGEGRVKGSGADKVLRNQASKAAASSTMPGKRRAPQ
jgi:Protein of unknown function (DUF2442)